MVVEDNEEATMCSSAGEYTDNSHMYRIVQNSGRGKP